LQSDETTEPNGQIGDFEELVPAFAQGRDGKGGFDAHGLDELLVEAQYR
jgi:hypothetical protein